MDEVNPSIAEEKLKASIVAIYVTGFVIGHWSLVIRHLVEIKYALPITLVET
ncbi:hypothetical protein LC605_03185 [Nostoc sp. CHAB 5836]|uniref:hypothetical protein n=1 Tax=Nostoc sp. CHAB 5836 TaxID=2780404 RepID=UPI001E41465A|nr:hypothetical protein [Nostoc sp. CHAB 5836]MCC5614096.1 hypothetical protein [Nostoc sp. CHAB 5836]